MMTIVAVLQEEQPPTCCDESLGGVEERTESDDGEVSVSYVYAFNFQCKHFD